MIKRAMLHIHKGSRDTLVRVVAPG
jgi:hypothetical protein